MKKRILIVDDDSNYTNLMASALSENEDYQVETTNDPHDAFHQVASHPIDLLISDWQMPTLNGDMLFLCIQTDVRNSATKRVPPQLLMMSGVTSKQEMANMISSIGGNSYLQKPFDIHTLKDRVEAILFETAR